MWGIEATGARAEGLRLVRFLLAGAAAAAANYGSRFLFSVWFSFEIAICLAFLVGLMTGFLLMRYYVFMAQGRSLWPQIVKYVAVNSLALLQTLIISIVFAWWLLPLIGVTRHKEAIAHAFGVAIPVVTSYLGHRLATFR